MTLHIARYPPRNAAVTDLGRALLCAQRSNVITTGATAGNIIAAIIRVHVTMKSAIASGNSSGIAASAIELSVAPVRIPKRMPGSASWLVASQANPDDTSSAGSSVRCRGERDRALMYGP